jgi:predicted negative regulator of RcsB-dependent stress response
MSDSEVRALVNERLKVLRIEKLVSDRTQLDPLAAATGGNPKAIEMTLGLVKYEHRPWEQVIDDLYAARGELFDDLFTRAWALLDEASRRVLLVMIFFPASASADALSVTADVHDFAFDRAVERLADLALLDIQQTNLISPPRYTLHPLVRAYVGGRLLRQAEIEMSARKRWLLWCLDKATTVGDCWDEPEKLVYMDSDSTTIYAAILWASDQHEEEMLALIEAARYYYYARGDWIKKCKIEDLAAKAAKRRGDVAVEARALAEYINILCRQDQLDKVEPHLPRLLLIAETTNLPGSVIFSIQRARAAHAVACDDFTGAQAAWEEVAHYMADMPKNLLVLAPEGLASVLHRQGQLDAAKQLLSNAFSDAQCIGQKRVIQFIGIKLAVIALLQGQLSAAAETLASYNIEQLDPEDRELLANVCRLRGTYEVTCGDSQSAGIAYRDAMDHYKRLGLQRQLQKVQAALENLERAPQC